MYPHTHPHIYASSCVPVYTQGHRHTCTSIPAHASTHRHMHAHTCTLMHAHAYAHTRMHTHTCTRTHAHTHTDPAAGSPIPVPSLAAPQAAPSPVPLSPRQHLPSRTPPPLLATGPGRGGHRQLRRASNCIAAGLSSAAGQGDAPPVTTAPAAGGLRAEPSGREHPPSRRAKPQVVPPALHPHLAAAGAASSPRAPARSGCPGTALAPNHPSAKADRAPGCPLNNTPYK